MAITDLQAAQQMAKEHPDLHRSRQIAFGQNYLQDLEQGTGTSQYYSGFGLAPDWVTGAIGDPYQAPVVQEPTAGDAQVAEQIAAQDRSASAVQPTTVSDPFLASGAAGGARLPPMDQAGAVAAMTQPEAYNIPGQMPKTPVSGAWGPQDYLQPETSDPFLASGAAGGARLPEEIDYTPTTESQSAWEKVQSGLGNIGDFIKTHGQTAANFFMNAVQPGLGLAAKMLPSESPIDKFNREYALGGDLYENVVSQVEDPKFEGRLEGYADDLIAGTGEGKDPFGINTVSQFGDYPAYATDTYNKIMEKEAAGKKLSQFDEDRKEYYGHISGLTGKTNIPGTPLMVDDSPLKTFPDDENIIIPPEKPEAETYAEKAEEAWKNIQTHDTIAGNTIYGNETIGFFPSPGEAQAALEAYATEADAAKADISPTDIIEGGDFEEIGGWEDAARLDAERKIREENERAALAREAAMSGQRDIIPIDDTMPENLGLQPYESWMDYEDPIMGMVDEDLIDRAGTDIRIQPEEESLIADKQMAMEFERQQVAEREEMERAARAREEAAVRASLEAAQRAEAEQRARNREEAAQRDREAAAERAAAERAAAQKAAAAAAAAQAASRHVGTGDRGQHTTQGAPTNVGNPFGYRAGGRIRYGKGGIVDLL